MKKKKATKSVSVSGKGKTSGATREETEKKNHENGRKGPFKSEQRDIPDYPCTPASGGS